MSKRPFAIAAVVFLAVFAAALAWFLSGGPGPEAPQENGEQRRAVDGPFKTKAGQLSGVSDGPRTDWPELEEPAEAEPQAEATAADESPAAENGDAPDVIREDPVVTVDFLDYLAAYAVKAYQPGPDGTHATFRGLNKSFTQGMHGLDAGGADIREARMQVMDYVFAPGTPQKLAKLYGELLAQRMADAALDAEKRMPEPGGGTATRSLTREEAAELLTLAAREARRTASTFRALAARPETMEAAARYLQAQNRVDAANARFQAALGSGGDTAEAGRQLKNAIQARERIRSGLVSTVKDACSGDCGTDAEIFYAAQWVHRRVMDRPERLQAVAAGADLLNDFAQRLDARAADVAS